MAVRENSGGASDEKTELLSSAAKTDDKACSEVSADIPKTLSAPSDVSTEHVTNYVDRNLINTINISACSSASLKDTANSSIFLHRRKGSVNVIRVSSGCSEPVTGNEGSYMFVPSSKDDGSREKFIKNIVADSQARMYKPKAQVKKPRNMYILYSLAMRPVVKAEHPEDNVKQIMSRIGNMWKKLPEDKRKVWAEQAEAERQRHREQNPCYKNQSRSLRIRREMYDKTKRRTRFISTDIRK